MKADNPVRTRALTSTRLLFVATLGVALVCGYIGLTAFVRTRPAGQFSTGFWGTVYYDLQLFVLGSDPLTSPGPYPVALSVARFAAPAVTLYALYEASRVLFAGEYRLWRNRSRRGHAIVIGDTVAARALSAQLRAKKRTVIAVVEGQAEDLRDAGVAGASAVYACADDTADSTLNVAAAQVAANVARRRFTSTLRVYAQVSDPTLALGLRARWLATPQNDKPEVDFFNVDELAGQSCLRPGDFDIDSGVAPHIVVAGLGAFGSALLVEYARQWPVRSGRGHERVAVTLVGVEPAEAAAFLVRWPVVAEVCDIRTDSRDLEAIADSASPAVPHRTFICYQDEDLALRTTLTAAKLWRRGSDAVVVRLNRLARHEAFAGPSRFNLLGDAGGLLRLASVTNLACRPEAIHEDMSERLAQAMHQRYLVDRINQGVNMGATGAMRTWADLDPAVKAANRSVANDVGRKLEAIGATVAPRAGSAAPFVFTTEEIEILGPREHDRWMQERHKAGWRYGDARNDAMRRHPSLVSWERLPESERQKDRDSVAHLVRALSDVGLHIVRLRARSVVSDTSDLTIAATV